MSAIPATRKQAPLITVPGYAIDAYALTRQQMVQLANLASRIMTRLEAQRSIWVNIDIEGHTDTTGSESHNDKLGTDRASTVAAFLRSQIRDDLTERVNFNVRSAGFDEAIASNRTEATRAKNRRVELLLEWVTPNRPPDRPDPPKPPKPRPDPNMKPPEMGPCLEFAVLQMKYQPTIDRLRAVYNATRLYWDGEATPLILRVVDSRVVRIAIPDAPIIETTVRDKAYGEAMDLGVGDAFPALAPVQEAAEIASMLLKDEKNRRIMSGDHEFEAMDAHRKLVASEVAKDMAGKRAGPGEINDLYIHLFEVWNEFDRLAIRCQEARGNIRSYPTIGPAQTGGPGNV